jgi:hypothetical protein
MSNVIMQCSNLLLQISVQGVISISPQMKLSNGHTLKNAFFSTLVKQYVEHLPTCGDVGHEDGADMLSPNLLPSSQ